MTPSEAKVHAIALADFCDEAMSLPLTSETLANAAAVQQQLAQVQADLVTRTNERDTAIADASSKQAKLTQLAALAQARKDADAQKVEGQDELDIING